MPLKSSLSRSTAFIASLIALPKSEPSGCESIVEYSASEGNYTIFLMKDKQKIIVSRPLKETEEMLAEHSFFRVHHSYLVIMNEIIKYMKGEGGYLVMSDGSIVDVSRSKKEILLKKLLPQRE